jgi:hypothetical protein
MSFLEKAYEIATAASGLAKLAAGGYDRTQVDADTFAARMSACKKCPHYRKALNQCGVCGCFLSIKARLLYDAVAEERTGEKQKTKCPEGLWNL